MKTRIAALIILSLALSGAYAQKAPVKKVQWDRKKSQYAIEAGAMLKVWIDDAAWGAAIAALWDSAHPEAAGSVEFAISGSAGSAARAATLPEGAPDIVLVLAGEASRLAGSYLALDAALAKTSRAQCPSLFFVQANPDGIARFIPTAYEGMVFSWNATMLEALGLDVSDKNKDGLPEAFDTWEEIFALSASWQSQRPSYRGKTLNAVFPICLDDPWSCYPHATSGGWRIFEEGDAQKPGFEKPMFRSGLEFIKAASEAMLWVDSSGSKRAARNCTWPWDDVLNGGSAPFGLIGSWMDVSGAERKGGHDLRFALFPTWKKNRLSPFAQTKSFAISARTPFPSAAHELMRLLNSKEGLRAMADSTRNVPILGPKAKIKLDFLDPNRQEMAAAFAYHFPEPALLLPGNPGKPAMDLYYGIGVNLMYRAVWDGSRTPEEAQAEIHKRSLQWLADNNALAGKPPPAADKASSFSLGDAAAIR